METDQEEQEEQRQIDEYFSEVHGFEQYAYARGYEVVYYIFWDYGDDGSPSDSREQRYWGKDAAQNALQCYQSERAAGCPNIRLYIEIYRDRKNDVLDHEDCLIAFGGFPV